MQDSEGTTQIRYDKGGNRIAESIMSSRSGVIRTARGQTRPPLTNASTAMPRTNQSVAIIEGPRTVPRASLQNIAAPKSSQEAVQVVLTAWLYHPTGRRQVNQNRANSA